MYINIQIGKFHFEHGIRKDQPVFRKIVDTNGTINWFNNDVFYVKDIYANIDLTRNFYKDISNKHSNNKIMNDEKKDEILRRYTISKLTPAELAIHNAMLEVEKLPADVRLTQTVVLLEQAKNRVSDYIDSTGKVITNSPKGEENEVLIVNRTLYPNPSYSTPGASGMDVRANIKEPIALNVGDQVLVKTGLFIKMPKNMECQVRPRSGLALKYGITVTNAPGTVDEDYRGEIGVILSRPVAGNEGQVDLPFIINPGDRIAQLVFAKVEKIVWNLVETLDKTERDSAGFGTSGVK